MKPILFCITVATVCCRCHSQNAIPSAAIQIKSALLAVPEEMRNNCAVYGYSEDKQLILLRKGTNELICVADDPVNTGFSVACYHKDLEPFMRSGRELRKHGMNDQQVFDEREKEVKAGTLQMPKHPSALYV